MNQVGTSGNLVHHVIIEDAIFESNQALESGGGLHLRGGFTVSIRMVLMDLQPSNCFGGLMPE